MLPLWSFLCWQHNLVWCVGVYGQVCDDLYVQREMHQGLDAVTMTMHVCAGVSSTRVYVIVCLQGVLQSQRYNGPTPSLCEVLQNNLKQSTATRRGPGLTFSWITSRGNSRYPISTAPIPLWIFSEPLPQHDWLDDVSVPAAQEEQDPKTTLLLPLRCTTFHSSSPEQPCYCSDILLKTIIGLNIMFSRTAIYL